MHSRCRAHYNTTSTRTADTFAPALSAIDTKSILDLQYAIAPFAKAQWDKHAVPLTISAYGASAGALGIFAITAAIANWDEDFFLSPRPLLVRLDTTVFTFNTVMMDHFIHLLSKEDHSPEEPFPLLWYGLANEGDSLCPIDVDVFMAYMRKFEIPSTYFGFIACPEAEGDTIGVSQAGIFRQLCGSSRHGTYIIDEAFYSTKEGGVPITPIHAQGWWRRQAGPDGTNIKPPPLPILEESEEYLRKYDDRLLEYTRIHWFQYWR